MRSLLTAGLVAGLALASPAPAQDQAYDASTVVATVNGNDIKLPTDGYKTPTDVERVLMGQLSSGKTGGDRAKPSLEAGPPATPAIGATTPILPATPVPLSDKDADGKDAKATRNDRRGKKGKNNPAPAPGFSIN